MKGIKGTFNKPALINFANSIIENLPDDLKDGTTAFASGLVPHLLWSSLVLQFPTER